jgi:hypothetical protein
MGGFFQLRYMMALVVAVSIDAFQFLIGVALAAIFNVPGVAGAILGCAISETYVVTGSCWVGGAFGGVIQGVATFVSGGAVQGVIAAIGGGLAAVVDFSIAATFGTGLIFLLCFVGMMKFSDVLSIQRTPFIVGELIPGANIFPVYTAMVCLCIVQSEAKEMGGVLGRIAQAAVAATQGNAIGAIQSAGQGYNRGNTRASFGGTGAAYGNTAPDIRNATTPTYSQRRPVFDMKRAVDSDYVPVKAAALWHVAPDVDTNRTASEQLMTQAV